MTKKLVLLFRTGLVFAVLVILYFTTTPVEYELAGSVNDKLSHTLAFLILSLLADFAFPDNKFSFQKVTSLMAYGAVIEIIQYFLPYRTFSILDFVADTTGVLFYLLLLPLVLKIRYLRELRTKAYP